MTPEQRPGNVEALAEAESAGTPFVHWKVEDGSERIYTLDEATWRVTIGRKAESDIALTWDPEVSRAHALLERVGAEWMVIDDGLSTNGSFVNGDRVLGQQRLHDHDRLCFGQTILVFREPARPEQSEATARVLAETTIVPLSPMQRKVLIALCRPVNASHFATPATNKQIADEVHLSVDAVKAHLRVLFDRFALTGLPQNEKRARLAERALVEGVLKPRDF